MDQEGNFLFSVARTECMGNAGKSGKVLRVGCPAPENLHFYEGKLPQRLFVKVFRATVSLFFPRTRNRIDGFSFLGRGNSCLYCGVERCLAGNHCQSHKPQVKSNDCLGFDERKVPAR